MADFLLRVRLLTFHGEPRGEDNAEAHACFEDADLLMRDGKIATSGDWDSVLGQALDVPVADHHPDLMMVGFVDTHIQFPQAQVIASWGAQLLDWLNGQVFPEETRFSDRAHAGTIASQGDCCIVGSFGQKICYIKARPEGFRAS